MSGFYDNIQNDTCYQNYQARFNDTYYDYVLNPEVTLRQGHLPQENMGPALGMGVRNYGKTANKITQESYLQGRQHVASNCPSKGVYELPEKLFQTQDDMPRPSCRNSALQAQYTREPTSCQSLSEADIWQFVSFPGAFQKGYEGRNSIVGTNIQSRTYERDMMGSSAQCSSYYRDYQPGSASGKNAVKAPEPRTSYGRYGSRALPNYA